MEIDSSFRARVTIEAMVDLDHASLSGPFCPELDPIYTSKLELDIAHPVSSLYDNYERDHNSSDFPCRRGDKAIKRHMRRLRADMRLKLKDVST